MKLEIFKIVYTDPQTQHQEISYEVTINDLICNHTLNVLTDLKSVLTESGNAFSIYNNYVTVEENLQELDITDVDVSLIYSRIFSPYSYGDSNMYFAGQAIEDVLKDIEENQPELLV